MSEKLTYRPFAVFTALAAAGLTSAVAVEPPKEAAPVSATESETGAKLPDAQETRREIKRSADLDDSRADRAIARQKLSATKRDLALARRVKEELQADKTISIEGKSVKVVAAEGVVYLRGHVADPAEVTRVENIAKRVAGPKMVKNQLKQEFRDRTIENEAGTRTQAE